MGLLTDYLNDRRDERNRARVQKEVQGILGMANRIEPNPGGVTSYGLLSEPAGNNQTLVGGYGLLGGDMTTAEYMARMSAIPELAPQAMSGLVNIANQETEGQQAMERWRTPSAMDQFQMQGGLTGAQQATLQQQGRQNAISNARQNVTATAGIMGNVESQARMDQQFIAEADLLTQQLADEPTVKQGENWWNHKNPVIDATMAGMFASIIDPVGNKGESAMRAAGAGMGFGEQIMTEFMNVVKGQGLFSGPARQQIMATLQDRQQAGVHRLDAIQQQYAPLMQQLGQDPGLLRRGQPQINLPDPYGPSNLSNPNAGNWIPAGSQ